MRTQSSNIEETEGIPVCLPPPHDDDKLQRPSSCLVGTSCYDSEEGGGRTPSTSPENTGGRSIIRCVCVPGCPPITGGVRNDPIQPHRRYASSTAVDNGRSRLP